MLDQWMAHGRHYQLQYTVGEHDNPDGRIAEDIHVATEVAIALAHTLFYSLLILGSFVDILLSVSGAATRAGHSGLGARLHGACWRSCTLASEPGSACCWGGRW